MDNAVALVQAYLRVNGYFTVSEFPIIELRRREGYRTATDLDILAFRFPGAGKLVASRRGTRAGSEARFAPDPELGVPPQQPDMIIGEVKEGRAVLNAATTDPAVLKVVLARFGCCSRAEAPRFAEELLRAGATILPAGHRVRLMAFGSIAGPAAGGAYLRMALGHVVRFLQSYLREHWALLRHEDSKDPALGFLTILEKCAERGS